MARNVLHCIHGVNGLVVAVGENGKILHFEGERCEPREVMSPTQATLRSVWVESPSCAWAIGDGVTLRWDGEVWQEIPIETTDAILGACLMDDELWVTTERGEVYRHDGRRWWLEARGAFGALRSICAVDGVLWCAGDEGVVIQHLPEEDGCP